MGLTYAEGMSKSELLNRNNIMILDKSEEKTIELKQISHFDVFTELEHCIPEADIIFIAVKPHHAENLLQTMQPLLSQKHIIISIMAGVTVDMMKKFSGIDRIVRAMPNLPAEVGEGMTTYIASQSIAQAEVLAIEQLLKTTGKALKVSNESYINASTAISGSGPAYVFYFMQSMMEAALEMGFSEEDARTLVSQTFTGSIALFNQADLSPKTWMKKVTSKGGTTQAALETLDNNKVNKSINEAVMAAFDRAVELGKEN